MTWSETLNSELSFIPNVKMNTDYKRPRDNYYKLERSNQYPPPTNKKGTERLTMQSTEHYTKSQVLSIRKSTEAR